MAKYSIQDTSLIAIGDAIRNKTGEHTRIEYVYNRPLMEVVKSSNAIDLYSYEGPLPAYDGVYRVEINIPEAKKIKLKIGWKFPSAAYYINISNTDFSSFFASYKGDPGAHVSKTEYKEDIFDINNLMFSVVHPSTANYSFFYAEFYALDEDGNEIFVDSDIPREVIVPNTFTPAQMATEIEALDTVAAEALKITGSCNYRFCNNNWNWLIEQCGDKIVTEDIVDAERMFQYSSKLQNIPFDLNFRSSSNTHVVSNVFEGCEQLTTIPKLINAKPSVINNIFKNCKQLVEIPEESVDGIDWSYMDSLTSSYSGNRCYTFDGCYKLRKFPMSFLAHGNPAVSYSYSLYYGLFSYCYSLDELINLPVLHRNSSWTSNAFNSTFTYCHRLKDVIFETNEDGSPIKINNWSKQAINLSSRVGYCASTDVNTVIKYAGFTTDTQVTDEASYQALKDNPDWWTADSNYSRYNHDSAVRTINSLPDVSAKSGNTITFTGAAGALTDGGAINTLTEAEIAVAAAKGWTVTLA